MQVFLLDVWQDLREKRLAPVAIVLLLGLVAVPVLLAKPAEDPGPAPVVAAPKKADNEALAALTKVKLGDQELGSGRGSTLGVFDPDNPFHPPKGTIKKDDVSVAGAGPSTGSQGSPGAGSTGAPGATGGVGGGVSLHRRRHHRRHRWRRRHDHDHHDHRLQVRRRPHLHGERPHAPHQGPGEARHAAERVLAAPDLHGRDPEGRRRGVPRGLDARGRRRGPLQAERGRVRVRLHRRRLPVHVLRPGRQHLRDQDRRDPQGQGGCLRREREGCEGREGRHRPRVRRRRPDASSPRSWPTS